MKKMRHGCGYVLSSYVLGQVNGMIVVNYRDEVRMLVWHCPKCGQALQLWWDDPAEKVSGMWERRVVW